MVTPEIFTGRAVFYVKNGPAGEFSFILKFQPKELNIQTKIDLNQFFLA